MTAKTKYKYVKKTVIIDPAKFWLSLFAGTCATIGFFGMFFTDAFDSAIMVIATSIIMVTQLTIALMQLEEKRVRVPLDEIDPVDKLIKKSVKKDG